MKAKVELLGSQKSIAGTNTVEFPVSDTSSVTDALNHVSALYPALFLNPNNLVMTVNGTVSSGGKVLHAGDVVSFLPVIGGG